MHQYTVCVACAQKHPNISKTANFGILGLFLYVFIFKQSLVANLKSLVTFWF